MNEIHFLSSVPKLVECSQKQQYTVAVLHVLPQIVGVQKCPISSYVPLLQGLEEFWVTQNLEQYMLSCHSVLFMLPTLD